MDNSPHYPIQDLESEMLQQLKSCPASRFLPVPSDGWFEGLALGEAPAVCGVAVETGGGALAADAGVDVDAVHAEEPSVEALGAASGFAREWASDRPISGGRVDQESLAVELDVGE